MAISDPLGFTAQGLEIIQINEEQGQFGFDRVKELVDTLQGGTICSGLCLKHEQYKRTARGS